jgi:teichuronic acid biosynthesis glycosyltransferase TuaG
MASFMNKKNQIDIILPTFNSEKFIINTINSIINQSFKNWRVIIVDDASTDRTVSILKIFYKKLIIQKKIILIRNRTNKGQSCCRNVGIKYSKSKFIAFMDSDDLWFKKKLEKQIKFMIKKNYFFTYTDYKVLKNNKNYNIYTPSNFNISKFLRNTSIATSTMIICRKIITTLFPNKIRLCEDYFFKCSLLKKYDAYKCPGVLAKYLVRKDSLQSSRIRVLLAVWKINKNLNHMNIFENLLSIIFISINSILKYGFR